MTQKDPFLVYDNLPPAIRKAVRETGQTAADFDAAVWLRNGVSEAEVLRRLEQRFNPICADLPDAEDMAK